MPDHRVTAQLRAKVITRAKNCCEYCQTQARFVPESFSVEHIIPRAKGGQTILDNLALACQGCNNHKYTRTEAFDTVTGHVVPLFDPRHHLWIDHFAWTEDFSLMIGLTPTGRATIEVLKLNRSGIVNLRRVLQAAGEHPPQ